MRVVLSFAPLLFLATAAPAEQLASPSSPSPMSAPLSLPDDAGRAPCRDRIDLVREQRGLPKLDRGTATEDEALLIAAVDHRIDGCSVMVMRRNTSDVRPLPAPKGPGRVQRIPGQ